MASNTVTNDELNDMPVLALQTMLPILVAAVVGAFAAVVVLPIWLPGLSASLLGPEPKAYWYLSRASALVAYALLWMSMVLGLLITNKMARIWPGGPTALDLHQHTGLLGLAFSLFHGLVLTGDKYIGYTLPQVFVPFSNPAYRPLWVGLGQVGFYLLAVITLSVYLRRLIGNRTWRLVHYLSFAVFLLALAHGLLSGTDTGDPWVQGMYWTSGGSLLFLANYRLLTAAFKPPRASASPANRSG